MYKTTKKPPPTGVHKKEYPYETLKVGESFIVEGDENYDRLRGLTHYWNKKFKDADKSKKPKGNRFKTHVDRVGNKVWVTRIR